MEGRHCFAHLTVEENLLTGAYTRSGAETRDGLERVYGYFPRLRERRHSQSGYTSGGEQQMTALGRGADGAPENDPAGRALDGARAAAGRGDLSRSSRRSTSRKR